MYRSRAWRSTRSTTVSSIDADGSGDVSVGDTLSYTITATSTGTANLTNVVVSDDLTGASISCALVAPNGTCVLDTTYVVADLGTPIANTGTADSDQTGPETDTESVDVPQPSLAIDKVYNGISIDADGSGDVSVGDTLSYTITATNNGGANLTNVMVSDNLTGASISCALVAPNGTCVLDTTYVVADLGTPIANTGTADSDQTGPETDTESVDVPQPGLAIDKVYNGISIDADGSGDVSVGDTLSYTITATSTGTANLTNVGIDDSLTGDSINCPLVLAAANNGGVAGTCVLDTTYLVTPADVTAGEINNLGRAASEQTEPVDDTESVPVPTPNQSVLKELTNHNDVDGSGDVSVDDILTYTITATNTGTANLTNVTIDDSLTGDSTSCALVLAAVNNGGVAGTCILTTSYTVLPSNLGTTITNTGTADSDQTGPTEDIENVDVPQSTLLFDKQFTGIDIDADGSGDVSVGDTLGYDLTATNNPVAFGGANLTNVTIVDTLTGTSNNVGTLGPNDTATVHGTYVVLAGDLGTTIINTGSADSDQTGPTEDIENVDVPQSTLLFDKQFTGIDIDADGSGDVSVGDTLGYDLTAINNPVAFGGANLTNVTIVDTLTGTSNNVGTLGPNDTATVHGTYVVLAGDLGTTIINTGSADSDQTGPTEDIENVDVPQSTLLFDKQFTGIDIDADGSGDVSVGDTLGYDLTAINNPVAFGGANLTNVTIVDILTGTSSNVGTLGPNASATVHGTYVVLLGDQGQTIENTANADSDQTDPAIDQENVQVPQSDLSISKDDGATVITAGDGVTYTYTITVTNIPLAFGGANLTDVTVIDSWPTGFAQGTVTPSQGTCGAGPSFSCDLGTILADGSATITVSYMVPSSTTAGFYTNTVAVSYEQPDPDPDNNSDDDTNEVVTDINLSIIKTFDPTSVPQGTAQSFTIEVSNAGPSDAVDVLVDDLVHGSLAVTGVTVTSGAGDCSASAGQQVDCTVQVPAGQSVLITVDYLTAPFMSDEPIYGTDIGDEFRFVFVNGSVLEGSTDGGPVFLDGVDVTEDVSIVTGLTRNDIVFDPPGQDPAFELHLSCSDPFTGGWGQSGGPIEGVDDNWQIAFFTIARYSPQGFLKNCGNVVNPFEVPNTATASGEDSSGTETVSDDATVTITAGINLDRLQTKGKRLTVRLTNFTGEDKVIDDISIVWPNSNGSLTKVWLTQDGISRVIWSGSDAPTDAVLDSSVSGWNGGTLLTGEGILRFDFKSKVVKTGYTIRANFADGTFLDINR